MINFKDQFKDLASSLKKDFTIDVILKSGIEDAIFPNLNIITINSDPRWETRFYMLLHEVGHLLYEKTEDDKNKFMETVRFGRELSSKSKRKYIAEVLEESLAWKYGQALAKERNYKINYNKYDKLASECIMSYSVLGLRSIYGKAFKIEGIV